MQQNPPASERKLLTRALAYFAAALTLGLGLAAFGPTLPSLADQTTSTLEQVSIIFTMNSLGYVLGSLLGGRLYARLPGQAILTGTMLTMALAVFLIPMASTLLTLVAAMALLGLGMGVLDVGGNTLLVWMFGEKVGPYLNAFHFSFGLGAFLSPLLIDRIVIATGGVQWAYWGLALLILPVAFWMTRIPSPDDQQEKQRTKTTSSMNSSAIWIMTICAAGLLLLHVGGELGYGGFVFSYGVNVNLDESSARLLNATFWGALALGRLVAIPLAVRLRPKTMLLLDYIGCALSVGLIMLLPESRTVLWIGTFGLGFSMASVYATVINFTERRMQITSAITSYLLVGANLGSMTVPVLIGSLFSDIGPIALMIAVQITIVLSLVLLGATLLYARSQDMQTSTADVQDALV